ncbi:MAG: ABC transporter ATP-binding protein, partial [Candidatus Ornithospirochaeta sp.]
QKRMEADVTDISNRFHLDVNPSAVVGELSIGEQQRVEILKLLASGAKILILDEPTAVLTPQESEALFKSLKDMAKEGKSILVITHKLSEVMKSADRITILRNGKSIREMLLEDTDIQSLTEMMVGHHVERGERVSGRKISEENVLEIKDISLIDDRGVFLLKNINLNLMRSEVLGIAGVSGNGQKELCEIIAGIKNPSEGEMTINGKTLNRWNSRKAIESGIAYIPDDRIGVALAGHLDAMDNMIMKDFMSNENSKYGILKKKSIRNKTERTFTEYDVRSAGVDYPVAFMSGGNIQKLLIAREVQLNPSIIVASYPTHGLDIGATESVHRILLSESEKGKSVVYVSEDLDELFEVSDRIAVMYDGKIVGVVSSDESSIEEVGKMMLGNSQERK